ncbi:ATP-dependent DNA ligase [Streptomyces sp. ALI-76-A]|uniref:ATP-dependent DNA ligase n=1 Tax=Streptomyces sp. ALI-76-A TaxID=3025736 RepID=UPI00256EFE0E|nr:ATP-dependent DNA ligase [Streptomyces sp. ALI-76-A]MDL5206129.1 ATP-dependent DNA ligase [Streptomyces sp. ALI-76-A]
MTLVRPELVEAGVDVARDATGRWRHAARCHRTRLDLSPGDVELFIGRPTGR